MKTMNRIITLTAILTVSILILYGFYGGFASVNFVEKTAGGETIIFKNTKGDYPETEKASLAVIDFLSENTKIIPGPNISYYDINPHVIDKKNLKSQGGCIIPSADTNAVVSLKNKTYKLRTLETRKYIIAEYPLKGKISILIAHIKIYPRLYRYVIAKSYDCTSPVTEIYDFKKHLMTFSMKIAKKNPENCM